MLCGNTRCKWSVHQTDARDDCPVETINFNTSGQRFSQHRRYAEHFLPVLWFIFLLSYPEMPRNGPAAASTVPNSDQTGIAGALSRFSRRSYGLDYVALSCLVAGWVLVSAAIDEK